MAFIIVRTANEKNVHANRSRTAAHRITHAKMSLHFNLFACVNNLHIRFDGGMVGRVSRWYMRLDRVPRPMAAVITMKVRSGHENV